jgi:DNA polymerase-3 subunit delta'
MNLNGIIGHDREIKNLLSLKKGEGMPHSILLTGQRGIGKRLIAERFLSSFLCTEMNSPCGKCSICRQISAGTFPDLIILERDEKGKIPVGNKDKLMPGSVRWLIDRLNRASSTGNYSVIIDGVDTISEAGQNALLKTIEEPYSKSYIFLIAESRTGILPTIISRCVEIPFQPLKADDILKIIEIKGKPAPETGLLAAISGGSADIALMLHDGNIFADIKNICMAISGFVTNSNNEMFKYTDSKVVPDNEFLLTVLINIYSLMVRNGFNTELSLIPEDIVVNHEDAVKVVRILLALKKGLGNNLNVKNILKGFMYSFKEMDTSGFPEPDFSWL